MDVNKKPWPLSTLCGIKEHINTNPDFQRPAVWTKPQKQFLIDTVLRNYDIPKLYWRKVGSKPDRYDVVDGQQRLRAIWEFHAGEFALPKDAEPINGTQIASLKYTDLPDELRIHFDIYPLDIVIITGAEEDIVRDMFLRLQNGTNLKAQEKRNAMPGKMRDFVKHLVSHTFYKSLGFKDVRYTYDHIAAQMTLIELNGGSCNVKNSHLNAMYKAHLDFDAKCDKARKIKRVLDYLLKAFSEKTPELTRYNVVSLYTLTSQLLEKYVVKGREKELRDWFIGFEAYRRKQSKLPEDADAVNPEMVIYHEKISHSTDSKDSIEWRHEFLMENLLEAIPDIELKDPRRDFTQEQRLAIFRRDKGICQLKIKCNGKKCEWDNWEADHVTPWSEGGKTVVSNGQVACPECNKAKSGDIS